MALFVLLTAAGPARGQVLEEGPLITVSEAKAGGYVFDKGSRFVEDPRMKVSMIPLFETFRSQAPLNVMVRMQWGGGSLLQGRVLCDIYAYEKYVGSWRSDEVAVNEQVLTFPLILPPSPLYNEQNPFNLRIAFETADRTILMDQRDLPIESAWSREFITGVIAPDSVNRISGFHSKDHAPLISDIFQLSRFHDHPRHATQLVVNTSPIVTKDVPLDPMRFTAFDLVVLSAESVKELRPAQWKAMATWIRAGGRACIIATLGVPENLRRPWLDLFNERPGDAVLQFDAEGRPQFTAGGTTLQARAGCGRVLCLTESVDIDSPTWTENVLWLYGVREHAKSKILATGKWEIGFLPSEMEQPMFHPLAPAMRPIVQLRQPLKSPDIRHVSMWKILLLLGTCLLLIGPVDYYALGRFGMRRWTWVLLPCVAIATTWATMRISQSALGAKDYSRSVSVADLDSEGKVVRVSRIEQHYAGRETVKNRELTNAFRVDFERPLYGWNSLSNPLVPATGGVHTGDDASTQPPLRYSGRVTGKYEVTEPLYQWSPRMFRETTFGVDPRVNATAVATVDWQALEQLEWATDEGRAQILALVRKTLPEATVYVRTGLATLDCSKPAPTIAPPGSSTRTALATLDPSSFETLVSVIGSATSCPTSYQESTSRYSRGVTRPWGLFGLIRERSPTCGPDLEDLQWIDADDGTEAVLMICLSGDDGVIFRRRLERLKALP